MKKRLFSIFTLCFFLINYAKTQDYLINFEGAGESFTIESIIVENLTQGTSLILNGGDILSLKNTTTGIESLNNNEEKKIKIYPNPIRDYGFIQFDLPETNLTVITLFDISGKKVLQKQDILSYGQYTYILNGLGSGMYIITIESGKNKYSGQVLCYGSRSVDPSVSYKNTNPVIGVQDDSKNSPDKVTMQYNADDWLKYTGISGIYSTIVTDKPKENKTITFNFISCTDGEGNNYPVVKIGQQVWMGENLKTMKFRDGTKIPLITDGTEWGNLSSPAYCWYNNTPDLENNYGALYNWHSVNTVNICPQGWHVPAESDWIELIDHLGGTDIAGGKLKETGTIHWWTPNTGATNETGFTALPGGWRKGLNPFPMYVDGIFELKHEAGSWWSSSENITDGFCAYFFLMDMNESGISKCNAEKQFGTSVRCIKDN